MASSRARRCRPTTIRCSPSSSPTARPRAGATASSSRALEATFVAGVATNRDFLLARADASGFRRRRGDDRLRRRCRRSRRRAEPARLRARGAAARRPRGGRRRRAPAGARTPVRLDADGVERRLNASSPRGWTGSPPSTAKTSRLRLIATRRRRSRASLTTGVVEARRFAREGEASVARLRRRLPALRRSHLCAAAPRRRRRGRRSAVAGQRNRHRRSTPRPATRCGAASRSPPSRR